MPVDKGAQAGDVAGLVLFRFPFFALDADKRPEQNGGGEVQREIEKFLIVHRLIPLGCTRPKNGEPQPDTLYLPLAGRSGVALRRWGGGNDLTHPPSARAPRQGEGWKRDTPKFLARVAGPRVRGWRAERRKPMVSASVCRIRRAPRGAPLRRLGGHRPRFRCTLPRYPARTMSTGRETFGIGR